jgi:hypothetical protein
MGLLRLRVSTATQNPTFMAQLHLTFELFRRIAE